jgi:hypothetical protein
MLLLTKHKTQNIIGAWRINQSQNRYASPDTYNVLFDKTGAVVAWVGLVVGRLYRAVLYVGLALPVVRRVRRV